MKSKPILGRPVRSENMKLASLHIRVTPIQLEWLRRKDNYNRVLRNIIFQAMKEENSYAKV